MTIKNLSYSSHRSLHVWDPAQQCTHHCGVHHLSGLPFALTAWGLGPVSATVTVNTVQPRRATRERQRQTIRNASHQAERGQELQLYSQNYSQRPLTAFYSSQKPPTGIILLSSTFTRQFRCTAHDQTEYNGLLWLKLLEIYKEGAIDQKIILCKDLGFDWFTCYLMTSKFCFIFKCHCLRVWKCVYVIVASCDEWSIFVYCQNLHCWHIVILFSIT